MRATGASLEAFDERKTLTASTSGSNVIVTDESGNAARVTIADVMQSNGVIHVVDKVLLPK